MSPKCPGQDQRYWRPEDIFDVGCPYCGRVIEFWKDEPFRICRDCRREVRNPRIDLGCAEWCAEADACLGHDVEGGKVARPVVELLMAQLEQRLHDRPDRLDRARGVCAQVDTLLQSEKANPMLAKLAALLAGAALCPEHCADSGSPPVADEGLLRSGVMRELLAQTGIEDELAEETEGIVRSVFCSEHRSDPQSVLVRDSVQLFLHRCAPPGNGEQRSGRVFHTQTAKDIAAQS